MTESLTNLDEAYRSIESGRHKQIRSVETGKWEVLIEGPYLESIVKELIAVRERIAELESPPEHTDWDNGYMRYRLGQLSEDAIKWMMAYRKAQNSNVLRKGMNNQLIAELATAIIPQAGDATILRHTLEGAELAQKLTGLGYKEEIDLLRRYLTAIEGGKL